MTWPLNYETAASPPIISLPPRACFDPTHHPPLQHIILVLFYWDSSINLLLYHMLINSTIFWHCLCLNVQLDPFPSVTRTPNSSCSLVLSFSSCFSPFSPSFSTAKFNFCAFFPLFKKSFFFTFLLPLTRKGNSEKRSPLLWETLL